MLQWHLVVARTVAPRCGAGQGIESSDSRYAKASFRVRHPLWIRKFTPNHLKTLDLRKKFEKRCVCEKNPLRTPAAIRKYPLTGGAEALTGRQTGRRATRRKQTSEADMARRAKKTGRISVNFVSTLFDN